MAPPFVVVLLGVLVSRDLVRARRLLLSKLHNVVQVPPSVTAFEKSRSELRDLGQVVSLPYLRFKLQG